MQENIDTRPQLRRQAVLSALWNAVLILLSAAVLLWLRRTYWPGSATLLVLALLNTAMILPLGWSLRARLHEIQGGEEDAARHY